MNLPVRTPRVALMVGTLLWGCQSTQADLEGLAQQEPLPYSVLVTGGAFEPALQPDPDQSPLDHTFRVDNEGSEAIPLRDLVEVLRAGRVFVRQEADLGPDQEWRLIAALQGPVPVDDRQLQGLLSRARGDGHDLLLVVQRLQDGPVDEQGINGSWPITVSVWLLLGLGMFIPDHTFESRANLNISLREVQTGRILYDTVQGSGPVDLALVARGSVWGIIGSIIIPPFWVPNDDEVAVRSVRDVTARRLLVSVARQLKGVEAQQELGDRSAALIDVQRRDGRLALRVEVPAPESLAVLRMRVDSQPLRGPEFDRLEAALLAAVEQGDGFLVYEAESALELQGELLQVLVQTTSGRVASETVRLDEL